MGCGEQAGSTAVRIRVGVGVRARGGDAACLEVQVVHVVRLPVRRLDATDDVHEDGEPDHDDDAEDEAHLLHAWLGRTWRRGGTLDIPHRRPTRDRHDAPSWQHRFSTFG